MNTSGWLSSHPFIADVPHFGAPTTNRFGILVSLTLEPVLVGGGRAGHTRRGPAAPDRGPSPCDRRPAWSSQSSGGPSERSPPSDERTRPGTPSSVAASPRAMRGGFGPTRGAPV